MPPFEPIFKSAFLNLMKHDWFDTWAIEIVYNLCIFRLGSSSDISTRHQLLRQHHQFSIMFFSARGKNTLNPKNF